MIFALIKSWKLKLPNDMILFILFLKILLPLETDYPSQELSAGDLFPPLIVSNLLNEYDLLQIPIRNEINLILLFSFDCVPCSDNITFWNKLYLNLKAKIKTIGIILEDSQRLKTLNYSGFIKFPLFVLQKRNPFFSYFKVNSPLTILTDKAGKIEFIKKGNLDADDFINIKSIALINLSLKEVKRWSLKDLTL